MVTSCCDHLKSYVILSDVVELDLVASINSDHLQDVDPKQKSWKHVAAANLMHDMMDGSGSQGELAVAQETGARGVLDLGVDAALEEHGEGAESPPLSLKEAVDSSAVGEKQDFHVAVGTADDVAMAKTSPKATDAGIEPEIQLLGKSEHGENLHR